MEPSSVDAIYILMEYPVSKDDMLLIEKAYALAKAAHIDQQRNSGEPYFHHCVEVAKNCARFGMDIETIVSALLHDTLEDTDVSEEYLQKEFGDTIVFLVKGVTKLGKLKYHGIDRHVESLRKFFIAISQDLRVLIIKLADRLHNVQTLRHVPQDKQKRIALETIEVHAALAGRLGMEKLKGLLEDYSFPFAYPKEYVTTKKLMDSVVPETQGIIEYAHKEVEKVLSDFSVRYHTIDSRIKHTYSTFKKLQKYSMNIEQIYDIVALRVLTESVADCYQVLGLIHMLWKPIPGRIKDYIALPKPNGYQSLHTTIITPKGIIEIQIRTVEMHETAEMGAASHLTYKEQQLKKNVSSPSQNNNPKKLNWINELKDLHTVVQKPTLFLEQLRVDFFKNRIFIFTPKGDVIDLPEGASPIDFGYAVHSHVGDSIASARINGKMAALGAELKNGDIVEILTGKHSHPTSKWMEYAKTSFARRRIRAYVVEQGGLLEKFLIKK